jgi:ketosteroid isomerase-like protein
MSNTGTHIRDLGARWTDAERRADVAALDGLAADTFRLVGPLGFVLDKQQWLGRYRSGAFVTHSLTWTDVDVRDYGDAAVAIGVLEQEAAYQDQPSNGKFRVTQILVRDGESWLLAGLHYSPIGAFTPPGAQRA